MQTLKVLLMVCHEKSKIVQMFQNDLIFVYVKIYIDLSVNAWILTQEFWSGKTAVVDPNSSFPDKNMSVKKHQN